jgi:hypothetical protein
MNMTIIDPVDGGCQSPPAPAPAETQFEIQPGGMIRERPAVVQWPSPWPAKDEDAYAALGLSFAFGCGKESAVRIEIWKPTPAGKTGGYFLIVLVCEYSGEHFWARDLGIALKFAREQAGLIQAGALCALAGLYQDAREDSDAQAHGHKNRLDREQAFERALDARRKKAA